MKILVPKLKTDHHREGHIVYISRVSPECCPVKFFEKYLQKTNMELCKDGETPLISRNFKTKKGHKISKTHGISHLRIKEVFKDYITDITEDSEKHSLHSLPANTPLYSTLKRRGNGNFHVVSTWSTRGVFAGLQAGRASAAASNNVTDQLVSKQGR